MESIKEQQQQQPTVTFSEEPDQVYEFEDTTTTSAKKPTPSKAKFAAGRRMVSKQRRNTIRSPHTETVEEVVGEEEEQQQQTPPEITPAEKKQQSLQELDALMGKVPAHLDVSVLAKSVAEFLENDEDEDEELEKNKKAQKSVLFNSVMNSGRTELSPSTFCDGCVSKVKSAFEGKDLVSNIVKVEGEAVKKTAIATDTTKLANLFLGCMNLQFHEHVTIETLNKKALDKGGPLFTLKLSDAVYVDEMDLEKKRQIFGSNGDKSLFKELGGNYIDSAIKSTGLVMSTPSSSSTKKAGTHFKTTNQIVEESVTESMRNGCCCFKNDKWLAKRESNLKSLNNTVFGEEDDEKSAYAYSDSEDEDEDENEEEVDYDYNNETIESSVGNVVKNLIRKTIGLSDVEEEKEEGEQSEEEEEDSDDDDDDASSVCSSSSSSSSVTVVAAAEEEEEEDEEDKDKDTATVVEDEDDKESVISSSSEDSEGDEDDDGATSQCSEVVFGDVTECEFDESDGNPLYLASDNSFRPSASVTKYPQSEEEMDVSLLSKNRSTPVCLSLCRHSSGCITNSFNMSTILKSLKLFPAGTEAAEDCVHIESTKKKDEDEDEEDQGLDLQNSQYYSVLVDVDNLIIFSMGSTTYESSMVEVDYDKSFWSSFDKSVKPYCESKKSALINALCEDNVTAKVYATVHTLAIPFCESMPINHINNTTPYGSYKTFRISLPGNFSGQHNDINNNWRSDMYTKMVENLLKREVVENKTHSRRYVRNLIVDGGVGENSGNYLKVHENNEDIFGSIEANSMSAKTAAAAFKNVAKKCDLIQTTTNDILTGPFKQYLIDYKYNSARKNIIMEPCEGDETTAHEMKRAQDAYKQALHRAKITASSISLRGIWHEMITRDMNTTYNSMFMYIPDFYKYVQVSPVNVSPLYMLD
uniref:WSSV057 n=1 Tax=White spot syndrome virus TaxID=342409 RepID=A0A3G5BI40_9VIRU|nr:WSSV057 [White spot syndrome virus]